MELQRISGGSAIDLIRRGSFANPRDEAARLTTILTPASESEALRELSYMFRVLGMGNKSDEDMRLMRQAFAGAVKGFPMWAIIETRDAFIAGKVDGYDSSFAPNSADFGRELNRRVSEYQVKLQRISKGIRDDSAFIASYRSSRGEWKGYDETPSSGFYEYQSDGKRRFSHDEVLGFHRRKMFPVGATWRAKTGQIFLPDGTDIEAKRRAS